jgi:hypothetical protein
VDAPVHAGPGPVAEARHDGAVPALDPGPHRAPVPLPAVGDPPRGGRPLRLRPLRRALGDEDPPHG